MTDRNPNTKRKRECKFEDEFELPVAHPDPSLPERELWTQVLRGAVQAAQRGNENAEYWLNEPNGVFVRICALLGLNVERLRSAVRATSPMPQPRKTGNQYTVKRKAPAPETGQAAVAAPWLPLSPAPVTTNAPGAVFGDPAPASSGWVTGPYGLTTGIPLPKFKRTRRSNVSQ